jgi:hypothetical protein
VVYQVTTTPGTLPTMSVENATYGQATSSVASNVVIYGTSDLQDLVGTQVNYITAVNGQVIYAGVVSTSTRATYLSGAVSDGLVTGVTIQVNGATKTVNNFASSNLNIPTSNPPNAYAVDNVIVPNPLNSGDTVTVNTDVKGNIVSIIDSSLSNQTGSGNTPTFGMLAGDVATNGSSFTASVEVGGTTGTYRLATVNPAINLGDLPQGAALELYTSGNNGTVVQAAVFNGAPGAAYVGIAADWGNGNDWEYTTNDVSKLDGMAGVTGGIGGFGHGQILGGSGSEVAISGGVLAATVPMKLNGNSTIVYDNVNQITENQGDLQPGYAAGFIYVNMGGDVNNNISGSDGANSANVSRLVEAVFVQAH